MAHSYDLMSDIQNAASRDALTAAAGTYFRRFGFEKFAYVILHSPSAGVLNKSILSNYPEEWQKRYKLMDYFCIDPTFIVARRNKKSFVWGAEDAMITLTPEQEDFLKESALSKSNPPHEGVSVPIIFPQSGFGVLSLATQTMSKEALKTFLPRVEPDLVASALVLHNAILLLDRPEDIKVVDYKLTELELEALYWLCQNKTYEDIAAILGLSREGVSDRLRKVYKKMSAVGKVDAVKKAIHCGLFVMA